MPDRARGESHPELPSPRFSTSPALRVRSWGEESLVYHCGTGDTHALGAFEIALLDLLRDNPLTHLEAADCVLRQAGSTGDDTERTRIAETLTTFQELGIIVRAPE